MKNLGIIAIRNLALGLICLSASLANAQLGAISATNTPSQVVLTGTARSTVNWSIIENVSNPGLIGVSSTSGVFMAPDNSLLGTVSKTLQVSRNIQAPGQTLFAISEALTVPQSVIRLAQKKGFNRFIYTRQFTDIPDNTSTAGVVTFVITLGGTANELSVRRVEMEYDDGHISAVVSPQSQLQARAILSYQGTGLLEYRWEVASPPSTQGQPIYIPLTSRKQYLLAGSQVVLQSPQLPTTISGNYLVRLKIDKPTLGFTLPLLRYAVDRSGQARKNFQINQVHVSSPAPNSVLAPATLFSWSRVPDAVAYQLEIYSQPQRDTDLPGPQKTAPLAGVLVPAEKNQLQVNQLSRAHLQSGQVYYWRIIALAADGHIIARSDFRSIHFQ